jgi:hypothetical protein
MGTSAYPIINLYFLLYGAEQDLDNMQNKSITLYKFFNF